MICIVVSYVFIKQIVICAQPEYVKYTIPGNKFSSLKSSFTLMRAIMYLIYYVIIGSTKIIIT